MGVQDRRDQSDRRAGIERDRQDAVGLSVRKSLEALWHGSRRCVDARTDRSEEHTSELQSLMRISYAVFCLKKQNTTIHPRDRPIHAFSLSQKLESTNNTNR